MFRWPAMLLLACVALADGAQALESSRGIPATGTIEFAFTPGGDAAGLVIRTIDAARSQVLMQAFSFTHRDIADALIRAHRRGIDVQVIADGEQTAAIDSSAMAAMVEAGVPLYTDAEHAAAHNKVIIVDHGSPLSAVVTGSFNFTFAAQNRNAENVLVLRGNPELADAYYVNWKQHREHAAAMVRSHPR